MHPLSKYSTQYRALLTTLVGIFFAEVVAMVIIYYLDIPSYWLTTLVDSSIMVLLIFPLLYYFSLRPLIKEIANKEKAETALQNSYKELENLVAERTKANEELLLMSEAEHRQRLLAEGLVQSLIALNTSLDLTSVLDQIMQQALRVIPATAVAVILVQDRQAVIARQLGKTSYPKAAGSPGDTVPLDSFPLWKLVCEKKESVIIPDTTLDPNWQAAQSSDWIRSALCASLTVSGQVIGIINLNSDVPNAFKPEMTGMLRAFATPAAVAIQNARLYAAEQKARLNAETLSAASTALTQTLEFESVLEVLLDFLKIAIPYDAALIVLSEEESRYHARTIRDSEACPLFVDEVNSLIEVKWGALIEGQILERETVLVPDVDQDPDWKAPQEFDRVRCLLSLPLETKDRVIGVVIVIRAEINSISSQNSQIAQAVVSQAAVAMQNAWLFEQVRAGREHLQMLSRRLVEVQETERREIARELHDETGQALTSLKLGLRLLEKDATHPKNVIAHVAELRETTDNVMESLHRLAMNLRPASLDHLGLIATLKNLVDNVRQQSGLKARFRALGFSNELGIPENIETALYRIVQEALTNIIRHAKATRADIILEHRDHKLVLIIEDDGRGFGTRELSSPEHLGIIGMRERTEQIGGKMILESTRGIGTTIVVEVPFGD